MGRYIAVSFYGGRERGFGDREYTYFTPEGADRNTRYILFDGNRSRSLVKVKGFSNEDPDFRVAEMENALCFDGFREAYERYKS